MKYLSILIAMIWGSVAHALPIPTPTITAMATVTPAPTFDPGYCGVAPFETGVWDPYYKVCRVHDADFNANKAGDPIATFGETTGGFIQGAAVEAARGVYAAVMFIPYCFFVTVIGAPLWYLGRGKKKINPEFPQDPQS